MRKEMQNFGKSWFWLPCMVAISAISIQAVYAQPPSPARNAPTKVGNVPVANVLQRLGAKLERGCSTKEFDGYSSHFDRTDPDRDGKHTRAEYVDKGGYMTPQARAGIFQAADGNADGVVTKAEYVLNRIITDEAKAIVQRMDDDKDGLVERAEFVKHAAKLLSDLELAEQVYAALDANADGGIPIPEYLRVWGQWARAGRKSAEERIAAQRSVERKVQPAPENCPACAMGLTAEFVFKRLDMNEDKLVTVAEFRRSPGMDDEAKAGEAVGRIDKDGNGTLTWEEFERAYKTRHAKCKKPDPAAIATNATKVRPVGRGDGTRFAQAFIMRSDKDGDGRISKSEFRGSDSGFERMDKNKNGFIESDELGELHQRRLADPKSMRERIQSGDIQQPPQGKRPERGAGNRAGSGSERPDGFSPFPPDGIGPGQAGLGRLASSGLQIGKPFPPIKIFDVDGKEFSTEQLKGHYTVLVAGCLTCPAFLGSYPGVEAVYRDYASKGVKFYYIYRALAHPENNGIVKPFSLKERLMHIVEARQRLKTQVLWLADNMNNDFKRTTGNTNNSEFVLDPEGCIVHMQMWSNGDRLRVALQEHVGPVAKPTTVAELGIPIFQMRPNTRGAVLPRIEVPGIMVPLKIEPKQNGQPFYVKLRAEAEQSVLEKGSGKIYLGFHIDPIHNTHWNNLAEPLHFEIKASSPAKVTPASGDAPKLNIESDSDPREFLVGLENAGSNTPLDLTVRYFPCSDEPAWCKLVEQKYSIYLARDEFGGAVFGRTFVPGGSFRGDPSWEGQDQRGSGRPLNGFGGQRPQAARPGSTGPPNAEAIFSRFDRNSDGKLTKDEVPAGLWQRLRNTDANNDGAITPEEFGKNRFRRPPTDPSTDERSGRQKRPN
ncbi:MAG: hypothetical protein GY774_24150 [Planctomycetes bacterium]|nr:hypothetical protein [Planctomycetota bacterium]